MFIEIEVDWHAIQNRQNYTPYYRIICININAIEQFYTHVSNERRYTLVTMRNGEDSNWYSTEGYESIREKITQVQDKFLLTGPL